VEAQECGGLRKRHSILSPEAQERILHWVDVYSRGMFELNNVETSRDVLARICPETISYFASGVRMSMYELGLMHAAARGACVFIRGDATRCFERRAGEDASSFLARMMGGEADATDVALPSGDERSVCSVLYRGDVDLHPGATRYALFREGLTGTVAASDLLA
jgi:hypothetical protein